MLKKIIFLIALLAIGSQLPAWLALIDMTLLRELATSVLIALALQPLVMHQFR